MLTSAPRWTLLSAGAVAAVLALSGCSGDDAASAAPKPAAVLPAPVASLATQTDVGQFFVTPKPGTTKAQIDGTIAKLRTMPGVQAAELKDGVVDVVFQGGSTPTQREAAVKQLGALGDVQEGI